VSKSACFIPQGKGKACTVTQWISILRLAGSGSPLGVGRFVVRVLGIEPRRSMEETICSFHAGTRAKAGVHGSKSVSKERFFVGISIMTTQFLHDKALRKREPQEDIKIYKIRKITRGETNVPLSFIDKHSQYPKSIYPSNEMYRNKL
jgi:hypothetical protein